MILKHHGETKYGKIKANKIRALVVGTPGGGDLGSVVLNMGREIFAVFGRVNSYSMQHA
jgi:hypothetical protein